MDRETRYEVYAQIPKGDWERMSGRSRAVINKQAKRYGFPLDRRKINLPDFVRFFHDWLAENEGRLRSTKDGPEQHPKLAAEIRLKESQAMKMELAVAAQLNQTICRKRLHETLVVLARVLRSAGERLEKHRGVEALEILNDALDEFDRITGDMLSDGQTSARHNGRARSHVV